MPDLPDALGDLVGQHQPDDRPAFDVLVRRRSRRRRTRAGLVLVAVGVAVPAVVLPLSLGGDDEADRLAGTPAPSAAATVEARFGVTYAQGSYDPTRSEAQRARCVDLPGVTGETVAESFPPQVTVSFSGSVAQRAALLACLRALPGAVALERTTDARYGDQVFDNSVSTRSDDPAPDGKQRVFVLPGLTQAQRLELHPCEDRPGVRELVETTSRVELQATGDAASRRAVQTCLQATSFAQSVQVGPEEPFLDPNSATARASAQPATFRLDRPADSEELFVELLVRERSCASGRLATGRIAPAVVTYTPTEVRVAVSVVPVAGGGRCPLNPETPYVLFLREGLDGRPVVDANAT